MAHSEIIPRELWIEILTRVDDLTLASSVLLVSKLFHVLTGENSDIWRHKCRDKFASDSKFESLSWKNYYWTSAVKLFPLFGFAIGKTSREELCAAPGSVLNSAGKIPFVQHKGLHFRVFGDDCFSSLYVTIAYHDHILPAEWEAKGLTWDKSWNEYKDWCKKSFGNYRVVKTPRQKYVDAQNYFVATLEAVVREAPDVVYTIKLKFKHRPGDVDTKSTLYGVFLLSHNDVFQRLSLNELCTRYYKGVCDDGGNNEEML